MKLHPTFSWRGQGSEILAKHPEMRYVKKGPKKATNQLLLNNFASINTETVKPADKTRKIQRGSMR